MEINNSFNGEFCREKEKKLVLSGSLAIIYIFFYVYIIIGKSSKDVESIKNNKKNNKKNEKNNQYK